MAIRVFVQNEAGSTEKHYHDEKTLVYRFSRTVAHKYPFPYGFIIGTSARDGCNVDCFVITRRTLRTGQIVECEPLGLMEQFENGIDDHNVLARLTDEIADVTPDVKDALTEHVLACFQNVEGKQVSVGRFLAAIDAASHIASHRTCAATDTAMQIEIREEGAADVAAIRDVNIRAFGQNQEADIVDALRAHGAASLSLVATIDQRVVGHIMYSPVAIGPVIGTGLGPMAVLPAYQRRRIGSRLVEAGNQHLKDVGCPFIVVLGHADFYPRFGFRPARPLGVRCEWDVPDDVFQILVLDPVRMADVTGVARYRSEFATSV